MRYLQILLLLAASFCFAPSTAEAQLFKRLGVSSASYGQTEYGYNYRGKKYVRGVDLPDNPNCPCPMCVDLVSAYMVTHPNYRPLSLKHLWPTANNEPSTFVEENASVKLVGTPQPIVEDIVKIFEIDPKKDFVLLDPGCGDARILIEAAKKYNARGIGIEINPETYMIARENIRKAGLEDKITLVNGDSRDYEFSNADGVVMFLFPDLIEDLTEKFDKLKSGVKVVSYSHDIPLDGTVILEDFYVWTKE